MLLLTGGVGVLIAGIGEGESMELTGYRYNYDADGNVTSGYEELHLTLELQIID